MKRDGRVVIRPDSGDPVDIICGLRTNPHYHTCIKEGKYYCDFDPFMDDEKDNYIEVSEGSIMEHIICQVRFLAGILL